jgi:TP901 family phage tail tape measure protein|tara:strand:+ start:11929 stop:14760 length:2832 start_codon:yes stop_codon:yes gene_type:complete
MSIKIRIVSDFDKRGIKAAEQQLGGLAKAAGVALAVVGAAMVGIGVKSVQEFAKFDGALTKSKAIMGELSDTMQNEMSDAAREVAKVTVFSAEQAAESFFFLASAGLSAEASIAALPQVAQFAQAGMFDMARATDLLTDAQSALGLTVDDASENLKNMAQVSDVLVRANTLANASVEQFSTALTTKAGAALRSLGKDVEEGVAVLAAFADQGIKGELAGTQLAIVLRDLTTKAINNKDAFAEMGISVFDSNGEMKNLGDIVGNLEVALAGMSDETQKATLLQLGFSDKSLASLQALLGTADAIKLYESELRSASGFTRDVAERQLKTFSAQVGLLESAFKDVAIEIGEELTPYLMELIPVLQDLLPVIGQKLADAIKKVDWAGLVEVVANFFTSIADNLDRIVAFAKVLIALTAAVGIYSTATLIAIAHTKGFTAALMKNPVGLIAVAIAGMTAALIVNNGKLEENINNHKLLTSKTDQANYSTKNLADRYKESAFAAQRYGVESDDLTKAQLRIAGASNSATGEMVRFNSISLSLVRGELDATKIASIELGRTLANNQKQLFYAMKGIDVFGAGIFDDPDPVDTGPSKFEQARDRVQSLIKDSQKQLANAQKQYNKSAKDANQNYADSVLKLQLDFADKLEGIIQQSQDRLRSAYKSAVQVNLATLFDQDEDKSVTGLVKSLSDKLTASRSLLANSAQLASAGFSQTFIEQIVAAGTDTGNELASAILTSTPEVQSELKSLFGAIEMESNQGMDVLAKSIYDKQGLATEALKDLYVQTGIEQIEAMLEQQSILENSLMSANEAFVETVQEIRNTVKEQVAEMAGEFGGLGNTIDQFIGKLDSLIAKYKELAGVEGGTRTNVSTFPTPGGGTGSITINPLPMPTSSPGFSGGYDTRPIQNNFTFNTTTDATQSTAMVGAVLGQAVSKYTSTGGALKGLTVIGV